MTTHYLTADEVTVALGISKGTLYSYVSRGLIRSEEIGGKTRARRYHALDVQKLQQRQEQRRNPAQAAATALFFGDPVLESAITLITDGQLYYRGHNALTLAATYRFEQVAMLLWGDTVNIADRPSPAKTVNSATVNSTTVNSATVNSGELLTLPHSVRKTFADLLAQGHVAEALQLALITIASNDLAAYQTTPDAIMRTGLRLLTLLTKLYQYAALSGSEDDELSPEASVAFPTTQEPAVQNIADVLQQSWAPTKPAVARLLDVTLILCADHELNASSFTARCVASTGATPYAAVVAALAALQGYKHGGSTREVATLFQEAAESPEQAVRARLRQGKSIPGFGHQLYPQGDPRARMLLMLAREEVEKGEVDAPEVLHIADELITITKQATQADPNLDFGLVVLAQMVGLPVHAPFSLFALGRTVGWIGHMIEQYELDRLIRPRAQYIGIAPQSGETYRT